MATNPVLQRRLHWGIAAEAYYYMQPAAFAALLLQGPHMHACQVIDLIDGLSSQSMDEQRSRAAMSGGGAPMEHKQLEKACVVAPPWCVCRVCARPITVCRGRSMRVVAGISRHCNEVQEEGPRCCASHMCDGADLPSSCADLACSAGIHPHHACTA